MYSHHILCSCVSTRVSSILSINSLGFNSCRRSDCECSLRHDTTKPCDRVNEPERDEYYADSTYDIAVPVLLPKPVENYLGYLHCRTHRLITRYALKSIWSCRCHTSSTSIQRSRVFKICTASPAQRLLDTSCAPGSSTAQARIACSLSPDLRHILSGGVL